MNQTCLEAKVAGRNRLNAHINQLFPLVVAALTPFVGQKIFKADGSLFAKIANALPPIGSVTHVPTTAQVIQSWKHSSEYSIAFGLRLTEYYHHQRRGQSSQTTDDTVYFGEVSKGILIKLLPFHPLKTDYSAAEVISNRADYDAKETAARDAKSKLYLFGEHDNF